MATLQVKGMDDRLYEALKARARAERRSISQQVVHMVSEGLARPAGAQARPMERLLQLAGSWQDERSPREIADDIRRDRRQSRRFRSDRRVFD